MLLGQLAMLSNINTILVFVQFRCSLQCRISMNLVFRISEDSSEIEFHEYITKFHLHLNV